MFKFIVKVFSVAFMLVGMIIATTLIGTLLLYLGWNLGLVPATDARFHVISGPTAFWLSLFISTVGSYFRSSVTSKGEP